jgi:hypothetical protein
VSEFPEDVRRLFDGPTTLTWPQCCPTVRPQRAAVPASTRRGAARVIPVGDVTSPARRRSPWLSPNQPAVLILRDVLDWSAAETAELLDTSVLVDHPFDPETRTRRHEKWRRAMAVHSGAVI